MPEEEVIKQDSFPEGQDHAMYFIGKGDCIVNVRDEKAREHTSIATLKEGDHFGEIGLIYNCRRSASVLSSNYNTLARLLQSRYRELVAEYPEYQVELKKHLMEYDDPKIRFMLKMIQKVVYLQNIEKEAIYDIMFSLVPVNYESGTVVLEQDSNADSLIFIEDGILEVYITLEGHEFILEKLHRGSVINFRAFFMQDTMYVNIRCQRYTKLLVLDQAKMNEIQNKYEGVSFSNKILSYQNKILKKEQKFPLDYIMSI